MSIPRDNFTFQFADLKAGCNGAMAMAKVSSAFVRSFQTSAKYEEMLTAIAERLLGGELDEASLKALEKALNQRQTDLLAEERAKDKDRLKKWAPEQLRKGLKDLNEDDDEDDEEVPDNSDEVAKKTAAEQEAQWIKEQERAAAAEEMRLANEERLRAQARKVDTSALDALLKSGAIKMVNSGKGQDNKQKKPNQGTMSAEEVQAMQREVAELTKESKRLQAVVKTNDEELTASVQAATSELNTAEAEAGKLPVRAPPTKTLNKGQVAALQQKLDKQRMERDRFALQLKSMEANDERTKLLDILAKRDQFQILLDEAAWQ